VKKVSSSKVVAIILARGGSKGIPGKNIKPFCGKPLLWWTLEQLHRAGPESLHSVWVSSDSPAIQEVALDCGARAIERPSELSGDKATGESGLFHALCVLAGRGICPDVVLTGNATSPLRKWTDFSDALQQFQVGDYDSMFSGVPARDLCLWSQTPQGLSCDSYDRSNPNRRRQDTFGQRWVENGSIYLFRPEVLERTGTRFGDTIGIYEMEPWQIPELDEPADWNLCESLMQAHLEGKL
jgi:N-acylneuraminate cytidylyltransferase